MQWLLAYIDILIPENIYFKVKLFRRNNDGQFIYNKRRINQKVIKIVNIYIYITNTVIPSYLKQYDDIKSHRLTLAQ